MAKGKREKTDGIAQDQLAIVSVGMSFQEFLAIDESKLAGSRNDNQGTYFEVDIPEPPIRLRNSDINELKKETFKQLNERLQIPWRSVIIVKVEFERHTLNKDGNTLEHPDTESQASCKMKVSWERWRVAEYLGKRLSARFRNHHDPDTWPGCSRAKDGPPRDHYDSSMERWPLDEVETNRPMRGRDVIEFPTIRSMIDDTPENRTALALIAEQMAGLYKRLGVMLGPDRVANTLSLIAFGGLPMLASPDALEAKATKPKPVTPPRRSRKV